MYALGADSLGCNLPSSKLAKVRVIVRGIALVQWMAITGGSYKTDGDASEDQVMLATALGSASEIMFRMKGDALGFTSLSLLMLLKTSRPTEILVRGNGARMGAGVGVRGERVFANPTSVMRRSSSLLSSEASSRPCSASHG